MAAGQTISLPETLLAEVRSAARDENRSVDELLSDAVQRYLDDRKWRKLVEAGEQRAKANGLTEADVPRLIEEVRRERRVRGR
jgi:Arc/MetJ-type ribon-helix-helix transcriptional regulator